MKRPESCAAWPGSGPPKNWWRSKKFLHESAVVKHPFTSVGPFQWNVPSLQGNIPSHVCVSETSSHLCPLQASAILLHLPAPSKTPTDSTDFPKNPEVSTSHGMGYRLESLRTCPAWCKQLVKLRPSFYVFNLGAVWDGVGHNPPHKITLKGFSPSPSLARALLVGMPWHWLCVWR